MYVLGIAGKARHGKDFLASVAVEVAQETFGKRLMKFPLALPLKARTFGEMGSDYSYEQVFHDKPPVVRSKLQYLGTEFYRNQFGEDFWVNQVYAFCRYMTEEGLPNSFDGIVISDVRFPNEVEACRLGGRASGPVKERIGDEVAEALGYTDELEEDLLNNDPLALLDLDNKYYEVVQSRWEEEITKSKGMVLYIRSNRSTLTGKAAEHPSEVSLDHLDKSSDFDGIIVNNRDTSYADLKIQIVPFLKRLFEKGI